MGSASKVILVGATSLIVGIFAASLKAVQTNDIKTALVDTKRVQFEQVQGAAVRTAMSLFVSYGCGDLSGTRNALGGGTYSYSFVSHWNTTLGAYDYSDLTLTATLDGVSRVITARVEDTSLRSDPSLRYVKQGPRKIHRGKWEVIKYYVARDR